MVAYHRLAEARVDLKQVLSEWTVLLLVMTVLGKCVLFSGIAAYVHHLLSVSSAGGCSFPVTVVFHRGFLDTKYPQDLIRRPRFPSS